MKEELVSYQQAKALKECGFDWECNDCYVINKAFNTPHLQNYASGQDWNTSKIGGSKYEYIHISAPRLDQAQKWLREVKKYEVNAFWVYEDSKWEAYCYDMTLPPLMGIDTLGPLFDSYESALSAGIDAALKLLTNGTEQENP